MATVRRPTRGQGTAMGLRRVVIVLAALTSKNGHAIFPAKTGTPFFQQKRARHFSSKNGHAIFPAKNGHAIFQAETGTPVLQLTKRAGIICCTTLPSCSFPS